MKAAGFRDPDALLTYMQRKGIRMSPELWEELQEKHRARQAAKSKGPSKKAKKGKKRRKAPKKSSVGIRTMKELDIALKLRKHGKPSAKVTRVKY